MASLAEELRKKHLYLLGWMPHRKPKGGDGIEAWFSRASPLLVSQEQHLQNCILLLSWSGSHGDPCASALAPGPFDTFCAKQANCSVSAIRVIRKSDVLSYWQL